MTKLLQTFIDGLSLGSFYALIALGYTMVYGILKFINFAHGDVFMLGAWMSFIFAKWFGWTDPNITPPIMGALLIIVLSMVFCGALGFLIEFFAYRPLRNAPKLNVLITAIGVSLLIQNICVHPKVFGTQPQRMPSLLPDVVLAEIAGVSFRLVDVIGLTVTVALMMGLEFLIFRTKIGSAMRAVSMNPKVAALMGINVNRVISATFVTGSSLAAAAGFLYAMKYPTLRQSSDTVWLLLGLKAFVAAVVGGIGNVRGAMLGGILLGLVEMFGAAYLATQLRDVYVFSVLIAVLLFRPSGLLNKSTVEKV